MRNYLLITLFFVTSITITYAQSIYLYGSDGSLNKLDMNGCIVQEVTPKLEFGMTDITFHPNGNLYGIAREGTLYQIDTITGDCSLIYRFDGKCTKEDFYVALTASKDGTIYAAGLNTSVLCSYKIETNKQVFYGESGYKAAGDLTFSEGNLYLAATQNRIVKMNLDTLYLSELIIDAGNIGDEIFGIVSHTESCNSTKTYAITNSKREVYEIDFDNNEMKLECKLSTPFAIWGGASTDEFKASAPTKITKIEGTGTTCGQANGSIKIELTGASSNTVFSLDGDTSYQISNSFKNLKSGLHHVTVNDIINGCTIQDSIVISNKGKVTIDSLQKEDISCDKAGLINVFAKGETGALRYSLDGIHYQVGQAFSITKGGDYTIYVRDQSACLDSIKTTIQYAASIELDSINVLPVTCGENNGSIKVFAHSDSTVDTLLYTIDGINYQESNIFTDLGIGAYTVSMKNKDCALARQVQIGGGRAVKIDHINVTDITCGSDGGIDVIAIGGTGDLLYSLDDTPFGNTSKFTISEGGTYTVYVKDKVDCIDSLQVEINDLVPIQVDTILVKHEECRNQAGRIEVQANLDEDRLFYSIDGLNYQESNVFDSLSKGVYTIDIRGTDCQITREVEILDPNALEITDVRVTNIACGKDGNITVLTQGGVGEIVYSLDSSNFQVNNVLPVSNAGTYQVYIQDANTCVDSLLGINVTSTAAVEIDSIIVEDGYCGNNGSIRVKPVGDVTDFKYSLDGIIYQKDPVFRNIPQGSYSVRVKNDGCELVKDATLTNYPNFRIRYFRKTASTCYEPNGTVTFVTEGGTGTVISTAISDEFGVADSLTALQGGEYNITLIDSVGCQVDTLVNIPVDNCPIFIPNAFTPNKDGVNDQFQIFPHPSFRGEITNVEIFDRWGALRYKGSNIDLDAPVWNFFTNGKTIEDGVYVYVVEITYSDGEQGVIKGDFSIFSNQKFK